MTTTTSYVGLHLKAEDEVGFQQALRQVVDPLGHIEQQAESYRSEGVPVEEVVIQIGDQREVLTFAQFRGRYKI